MFPQTPQPKSSKGTYVLLGILIGIVIVLLGIYHVEPLYSLWAAYVVPTAYWIKDIVVPTATNYVSANPLSVLTASVTIGGVVGGKLLQSYYSRQKEQLQQQAQLAITDNVNMAKSYTDLQTKYDTLQSQLKNTEIPNFKTELDEAQQLVTQKNTQIQNLQATIEYQNRLIQDLKSNVVEKTVVK
jgi:predicted alpha/beta-fold hydrolase